MVPPDSIFGSIQTWIGVYLALIVGLAVSGHFLYHRVIKLVLLGRQDLRFDQLLKRLFNFLLITPGQKKVLQRFSLQDRSGLGHVIIF